MRRVLPLALVIGFLAPLVTVHAGDSKPEEDRIRRAVEMARDRVYPALVNIGTVTRAYRGGRAQHFLTAGSGVIVSPGGHVLTNFHVAEDATRITCRLPGGEEMRADIVTHDPLTDLSVLKLRMKDRKDPTRPIPFAAIGNSSKLEVGDQVLAMGNPRSLSSSVTLGIVANTNRVFKSFTGNSIEGMELSEGQPTGLFTQWIQHDALIQPGNSGGPLVNMEGEVVGINELAGGGMSFAIPSNLAKEVLNRALTFGEVRRGWLGVTAHPVKPLDRKTGALVASILEDGPAAKAGIQPGDVILAIGDNPTNVLVFEDVPSFYTSVANLPVGKKQHITFLRDGKTHEVYVEITLMERFLGEERVFPIWGVSAMAITGPMAFSRRYPDTSGVVLTSIRPGKAPEAARPRLSSRDVILEIGGDAVTGLDSFAELQKKHKRVRNLLVRYRRGQTDMITSLDMTRKPPRKRGTELAKAWLGVTSQVMTTEVSKALGLEGTKGFRITRVLPASPAKEGGVLAGDILTKINDEEIQAWRMQDGELLRRTIEDMDIDSEVTFTVLREGAEKVLTVTLGETPGTSADVRKAEDEILEYKVRELTYGDRVDNHWPADMEGVLVGEVVSGGWANVAGLLGGDLLLKIQGERVGTIKAFKAIVKKMAKERPEQVVIFVRRDRATRFVFIEPEWPTK